MSYEALKEKLRGVAFTTATPFSENGEEIRYDELERNVTVIEDAGGRLFIPCGNIGEYYALTDEQRVAIVKATVDAFSQAVERVPGDIVWSNGIAERFAPAFAVKGAVGFTTGIGNIVPTATLEFMDALRDGEYERAKEVRNALRPYENLREETGGNNPFSAVNNVPAVKYGMELAGLYGGPVREPLVELSEADKARTEQYDDEIQTGVVEAARAD